MFCRITPVDAFSGYPKLSMIENLSLLFTLIEIPDFKATNSFGGNYYILLPSESQTPIIDVEFLIGTNLPSTSEEISCLWKDLESHIFYSTYT